VSSPFQEKMRGKERSHSLEKSFAKIIITDLIWSSHFGVKVLMLIPLSFEFDNGLSALWSASGEVSLFQLGLYPFFTLKHSCLLGRSIEGLVHGP